MSTSKENITERIQGSATVVLEDNDSYTFEVGGDQPDKVNSSRPRQTY